MTESTSQNKLMRWKRALIGGLLSAGIAGLSLLFSWLTQAFSVSLLFTWPVFYWSFFISNDFIDTIPYGILSWFFLGSGVAFFSKTNRDAVQVWLLPFIFALLPVFAVWILSVILW